ncbi:MAG: OmpA family protein [Bacteroidota bacterium]
MKTFWIGLALVIWIAGSSFVYVCHIRDHCSGTEAEVSDVPSQVPQPADQAPEVSSPPAIDEPSEAPASDDDKTPEPPTPSVTINERPSYVVTFEAYQTTVDASKFERDYLQDLLFAIENNRVASIGIEGHSDTSGASALNERLSRERAASVRAFLIEQGVSDELIVSRGIGSEQPRSSNVTGQGRSNNRRVEIKTTYQP